MPGVEYGQCKRSNYSLNHQFLDTDFLDSACANDFTILPAISDSDAQLLNLRMPEAVDYLSSTLESEQYFNCWKAITNNRFMKPYDLSNMRNLRDASYFEPVDDVTLLMPSTSSPRLENACWRAWYKSFRHLKELDRSTGNGSVPSDISELYEQYLTSGIIQETSGSPRLQNIGIERDGSRSGGSDAGGGAADGSKEDNASSMSSYTGSEGPESGSECLSLRSNAGAGRSTDGEGSGTKQEPSWAERGAARIDRDADQRRAGQGCDTGDEEKRG